MKRTESVPNLKWLLLFLLLALPFATLGQQDTTIDTSTGNGLYTLCNDQRVPEKTLCAGYIIGSSDAFGLLGRIDLPNGATNGQIVDVVKKYLADNPATRNETSSLLILRALVQAFPPKSVKKQ